MCHQLLLIVGKAFGIDDQAAYRIGDRRSLLYLQSEELIGLGIGHAQELCLEFPLIQENLFSRGWRNVA